MGSCCCCQDSKNTHHIPLRDDAHSTQNIEQFSNNLVDARPSRVIAHSTGNMYQHNDKGPKNNRSGALPFWEEAYPKGMMESRRSNNVVGRRPSSDETHLSESSNYLAGPRGFVLPDANFSEPAEQRRFDDFVDDVSPLWQNRYYTGMIDQRSGYSTSGYSTSSASDAHVESDTSGVSVITVDASSDNDATNDSDDDVSTTSDTIPDVGTDAQGDEAEEPYYGTDGARTANHVFEVVHTEQAQTQLINCEHAQRQTILEVIHRIACGETEGHTVGRRHKVGDGITMAIHCAHCGDHCVLYTYDFRCNASEAPAKAMLVEVVQIWHIVHVSSENDALRYIEQRWSGSLRRFAKFSSVLSKHKVNVKEGDDGVRRRLPRIIQTEVPSDELRWIEPFFVFPWQHWVDLDGNYLRLILAPEEEAAAKVTGILILNGRAGAGKTVVMRERLWAHYVAYRAVSGTCRSTMVSVSLSEDLAHRARNHFETCHNAYLPTEDPPLLDTFYDVDARGDVALRPGVCIVSLRGILKVLDVVLPPSGAGSRVPRFFDDIVEKTDVHQLVCLIEASSGRVRQEVTFADFRAFFWPAVQKRHMSMKRVQYDPRAVWQELQSFIKGSIRSREVGVGEYAPFSKQTVGFRGHEAIIIDVAQKYAAWQRKYCLWDRQDAALHILQRLEEHTDSSETPFTLPQIDELYVDEVQDLSPVELTLLLRICVLRGLNVTGDAAQIVSDVHFRFCDFRSLLRRELQRRRIDDGKIPVHVVELTVNHRSCAGIVDVSNVILKLLALLFPTTIDRLAPARATHCGEKPAFMTRDEFFATFTSGMGNQPQLGANQIVLVPSLSALPENARSSWHSATPSAVKGLEYDDVFIFDWFSASDHRELWSELASALVRFRAEGVTGDEGVQKNELRELWQDHLHAPIHIQMKHLLVAVTRARFGLVFVEQSRGELMMDWLINKDVVDRGMPQKFRCGIEARAMDTQTAEQWVRRGNLYFNKQEYDMALGCYRRCDFVSGEEVGRKIELCEAYLGKISADADLVEKAAVTFQRYNEWRLAADCFVFLGKFEKAGYAFEMAGEHILAAENFQQAAENAQAAGARANELFKSAGRLFLQEKKCEIALDCFGNAKLWEEFEDAARKGFESRKDPYWPTQLKEKKIFQCAAELFEALEDNGGAAECFDLSAKPKNNVETLKKAYDHYLIAADKSATNDSAELVQKAGDVAMKSHGPNAPELWELAATMLEKRKTRVSLCTAAELWKKVADAEKKDNERHVNALTRAEVNFRGGRKYEHAAECCEAIYKITHCDDTLRQAAHNYASNKNWDKEFACLTKLRDWVASAQNRERIQKWQDAARLWGKVENWRNQGDCLIKSQKYLDAAEAFLRLPDIKDTREAFDLAVVHKTGLDANFRKTLRPHVSRLDLRSVIDDGARVVAVGLDEGPMAVTHLAAQWRESMAGKEELCEVDMEQLQAGHAFLNGQTPYCGEKTVKAVKLFLNSINHHADYVACILHGQPDVRDVPFLRAMRDCEWFATHVGAKAATDDRRVILPAKTCTVAVPLFGSKTLATVAESRWKALIRDEVRSKIKAAFCTTMRSKTDVFEDKELNFVDTVFDLTKVTTKDSEEEKVVHSLVDDEVVETFWATSKDMSTVPDCFKHDVVLNGIRLFSNVVRAVFAANDLARARTYLLPRQSADRVSDNVLVTCVREVCEPEIGNAFLLRSGLRYVACELPDMWTLLGEWKYVNSKEPDISLERRECPTGNDALSRACWHMWHAHEDQRWGKSEGHQRGEAQHTPESNQKAKADWNNHFTLALRPETCWEERLQAARCVSLCLHKADSNDIVELAIRALLVFRQAVEYCNAFPIEYLLTHVERRMLIVLAHSYKINSSARTAVTCFPRWRSPCEGWECDCCPDLIVAPKPEEMEPLKKIVEYNCRWYVENLVKFLLRCSTPKLIQLHPIALITFCDCGIFFASVAERSIQSLQAWEITRWVGALLENIIAASHDRRASSVCRELSDILKSAPRVSDALMSTLKEMSDFKPAHLRLYMIVFAQPESERSNIDWTAHAFIIEPLSWQDIDAIVPDMLDNACGRLTSSVLALKFIEREFATNGHLCLDALLHECLLNDAAHMRQTLLHSWDGDLRSVMGQLESLKAISGVESGRGKLLVDAVTHWLPKHVVPLRFLSPVMVILLRAFRTTPPRQQMDSFGESAIKYGREMLWTTWTNDSIKIKEAYSLFMLADVSSTAKWQFTDAPRDHATTRQKFWHALQDEQKKRAARLPPQHPPVSFLKHQLGFFLPLYLHVSALFRVTKGTPADASVGRMFRTPPIDLFVNVLEARLRESEDAKKRCQEHDQHEGAAKSGRHQDMHLFYSTREKLKVEWEKTFKTFDVTEILDMAQEFLVAFANIDAPEVLDAILEQVKAIIEKKTWNDENISKVLDLVRQQTDENLNNHRTRSAIFFAQCFNNRAAVASRLLIPVGETMEEIRSTAYLSEYLLEKCVLNAGAIYEWPNRKKMVHKLGARKLHNQENWAPKNSDISKC